MPNPTYHNQDIVQAVYDLLVAAAPSLGIASNNGVYDVYYGDQVNVPRTPAICVEPAAMRRELQGASNPPRMLNSFNVLIMVYLQELGGIQKLNKDKDLLLDKIQDALHADYTLGGKVLFGYCSDIDPGYAVRSNVLMRCGKISFTATNKSFLID